MYSGCVGTYAVWTYGRMAARAAVGESERASDMRRMQSWPCVWAVVVQRGRFAQSGSKRPLPNSEATLGRLADSPAPLQPIFSSRKHA